MSDVSLAMPDLKAQINAAYPDAGRAEVSNDTPSGPVFRQIADGLVETTGFKSVAEAEAWISKNKKQIRSSAVTSVVIDGTEQIAVQFLPRDAAQPASPTETVATVTPDPAVDIESSAGPEPVAAPLGSNPAQQEVDPVQFAQDEFGISKDEADEFVSRLRRVRAA